MGDYRYFYKIWNLNTSQSHYFEFEVIDGPYWHKYFLSNWYFCLIAVPIYLVTIFGIKFMMSSRSPFNLKRELFVWNAGLGIFSILGFLRTIPRLISMLSEDNGFFNSICINWELSHASAYWYLAFTLSKYVELGDTVFIVLRKRPLVFLQWYHHIITLITVWLSAAILEPVGSYYIIMNYGVHSLMYPYFALKALDVNIPRWISNIITTLQLTQMLVGFYLNAYTTYLYATGTGCLRDEFLMKLNLVVYGSFVILFGKLFLNVITRSKHFKGKSWNGKVE